MNSKNSRKTYRREFKMEAVNYAVLHKSNYQAAKKFGVGETCIRRWRNCFKEIAEQPQGTRTKRGKTPYLPILEEKLNKQFQLRKKDGRKTTEKWFIYTAKKLHEKSGSKHVCSFSRGWFRRFKDRYNISKRIPTQKGSKPTAAKEPLIRDFHQQIRNCLREIGPLPPSNIANCDQTPMPFAFWGGKTCANKGDKQVWVKTLKSGDEKRFCTVHLTVFADGKPRVKPLIIFRGAGKGIKTVEKNQYHPKAKVQFQKNAWCDEIQFEVYVNSQLTRMKEAGPLMLILDAHRAQKTDSVKKLMTSKGIRPVFVPPGCTGQVQVLDVAFNKEFKSLVSENFDQYMELNFDKLNKDGITASEKRVLITKWVGRAWNRMHGEDGREPNETVKKAFAFTGVTLPLDGSRDDEIKIHGLDNYKVGLALAETLPSNKEFTVVQSEESDYEDSIANDSDDDGSYEASDVSEYSFVSDEKASISSDDSSRCIRNHNNVVSEFAWEIRKENTMIGHIPESLAEVLSDLFSRDQIAAVVCKVTGYRQPAVGGIWQLGGGIVVPCTYKIYGREIDRDTVRTALETAEYRVTDVQ